MVSCTECGKVFHNKSNLNRHMRVTHGEDGDENDESEDDVESVVSEEESPTEDEHSSSSDTEEVDVWKVIADEADDEDGGVLESFKRNVMFCRSLKRDETYQAVMNTVEKAKDEDGMEFTEALEYSVDKRKFLIRRSAEEAEGVRQEEEQANAE